MRKLYLGLLGVVITLFSVTGCSSLQAIDDFSESNSHHAHAETEIEPIEASIPVEQEQTNEGAVKEAPDQLTGFVEDEILRVSLLAQLESDRTDYKTTIEFHNKSGKSVDLIFDCGLVLSNDHFAAKAGSCPAVESMLLKKNGRESVTVSLSRAFFDVADNVITIRYRQDSSPKDLEVKLEASDSESESVNGQVSLTDSLLQQYGGAVHQVWMTTPIPSSVNYVPLFADLDPDKERIENILSWIAQSEKVDEEDLVSPVRGRSMAVNIGLGEDHVLVIRPAWTCETKIGEQGNYSQRCTSVQDRVWMSWPDGTEIFAKSPELFELATRTFETWVPAVEPMAVPEEIQIRESFTVSGKGWLAQKVRAELMKHNELIWSRESMVEHGTFTITDTLPLSVSPGDYQLNVHFVPFGKAQTGTSRMGTSVIITK